MRITPLVLVVGLCAATACAEKKQDADELGGTPATTTQAPAAVLSTPSPEAGSVELKEAGRGLLQRAKIADAAARTTALDSLRGGTIVSAEIEDEDGALIYSYDVQMPGRSGIEEVHVDALTGRLTAVEHEDPSVESAEGKQEGAPTK